MRPDLRFTPGPRGLNVGVGCTLAPLLIWAVGTLPPPVDPEIAQAQTISFSANVGAYKPGTATYNAALGRPVQAYAGGAILHGVA